MNTKKIANSVLHTKASDELQKQVEQELKLEDGTKIKSVANRMLVMSGAVKHTGSTCTDEKCRVVINFNYT